MSERYSGTRKTYFVPSTVENIDRSVYDYIRGLSLHVDTNAGFQEVPVLWGTSERSFLSKDKKEVRVFKADKMWGLGTPNDLEHFLKNFSKKP